MGQGSGDLEYQDRPNDMKQKITGYRHAIFTGIFSQGPAKTITKSRVGGMGVSGKKVKVNHLKE